MWQSIIELLKQFFSSISSVSDTTKVFVPIIEKEQEIRIPVKIKEAENDVMRKEISKDKLLEREIRKDLKHGYEIKEIIEHYKGSLGIDVSIIAQNEFDRLKNNKKRLKNYGKNK